MECRICFDDEDCKDMIAPCKCNGSQKFVHRKCLQEFRMSNGNSSNLVRCPTCQFEYIFEEEKSGKCCDFNLQTKFYLYVARDILTVLILWNIVVILFGLSLCAVYFHPTFLSNNWDFPTKGDFLTRFGHGFGFYYCCGILFTLFLLGIFGCAHGCLLVCSDNTGHRVHHNHNTCDTHILCVGDCCRVGGPSGNSGNCNCNCDCGKSGNDAIAIIGIVILIVIIVIGLIYLIIFVVAGMGSIIAKHSSKIQRRGIVRATRIKDLSNVSKKKIKKLTKKQKVERMMNNNQVTLEPEVQSDVPVKTSKTHSAGQDTIINIGTENDAITNVEPSAPAGDDMVTLPDEPSSIQKTNYTLQ